MRELWSPGGVPSFPIQHIDFLLVSPLVSVQKFTYVNKVLLLLAIKTLRKSQKSDKFP
jgi:hypothetical protein